MICEKCQAEHDGSYASGRFCSSICAKSFSTFAKRTMINEKIRVKLLKPKTFCKGCGAQLNRPTRSGYGKCCIHNSEEYRQKLKNSVKGKCGGYRENSGRGKKGWYNSPIAGNVFLQSSWELLYAKYLDEQNILWKRNTTRFYYSDGNKQRYYIPDFYLPNENIYIEIKGFKTTLDDFKWNSVKNLKVLYEFDLKQLKIL